MSIDTSWVVNVSVAINVAVTPSPTFNGCMIAGVFPTASRPVGWGTALAAVYSTAAAVSADFTPLYTAAITAENFVQAYKYAILLKASERFFSQDPVPSNVVIGCIDNTSTVNYVTALSNIVLSNNSWFSFYIADQTTATLLTQTNGIYAAVAAQVSAKNPKVCFLDSSDMNPASGHFFYDATNGGIGSKYVMLFGHSLNPVYATVTSALTVNETLAPAAMAWYFTSLFNTTVGLKSMYAAIFEEVVADPYFNDPSVLDGLLAVNANVYPAVGGSGYVTYGYMASTTSSNKIYLDQVVGAVYIDLNTKIDLFNFIRSQADVGGLDYDDAGIQQLLAVLRATLQRAVNLKIIQQFKNSDVTAVPYAQVSPGDKAARYYQGLAANLTYLSRIQRLFLPITIQL